MAGVAAGEEKPRTTPQEIARLIGQLGAEDDRSQESAARALLRIGQPALGALRRASSGGADDATGGRARMLVRDLEPHPGQAWCIYAGGWEREFFEPADLVCTVAFSPD